MLATKRRRLADDKLGMRLACGRTVGRYVRLAHCQFLSPPPPVEAQGASPPSRPAPGLSVLRIPSGDPGLVIDTFHRRGTPMADVAPVAPNVIDDNYRAVWNKVTSARHRDWRDVALSFVACAHGSSLLRVGDGLASFGEARGTLPALRPLVPHAAPAQPTDRPDVWVDCAQVITPVALERHLAETRQAGTPHKGAVCTCVQCARVLQGLPLSLQIDCRTHVCVGCRRRFPVLASGRRREIPD